MLDHERIVEEIQAALASPATADWDLLRDTAAEFAAACEEVNGRLAECQRLLKQGLRSEAIQAAEREPNVLDGVAVLDFPEAPQWQQMLASNGLAPPPALRIDVATDLNSAYAAEAPLQSLLKTHRLLALSRAPLLARIEVLRKLCSGDMENPIWYDDLHLLESARHAEVQKELDVAVGNRDLTSVARLTHELAEGAWVYPPQAKLVTQAKEMRQRLAVALATEEMERIEHKLSNAHTALDIEAGRLARQKWNGCQQVANLPDRHALMQRAAPALAWLAEQDQHKQRNEGFMAAVAMLEDALEADASRPKLERLHHAARRYDEEIPLHTARRYQERIRSMETATRRRFALFTTVGVAALLLAAVGVAWAIYRGQRSEAIDSAAKALARFVEDKNTAEGLRYFEELKQRDPNIAAQAEIQQEVGRLNGLVTAESNRRESFEALLVRTIEAGLDTPDRMSMNEAEKLAATLDEKSRVADWRARVNARDRERQRARDQQFENELQRLLTAVEGLEKKVEMVAGVDSSDVSNLLATIEALQSRSGAVTQQLSSQVSPLRLRVVALERQMSEARSQQQSLARLTAAVGNADVYQSALEGFVKQNALAPLSAELQRATEEIKWCKGTLLWSQFLAQPRFADLARLDSKEAKALVARAETLLQEAGDVPLAEVFKERQQYLQRVADRLDESGNSKAEILRTVFDDALIRGLWMMQTKRTEQKKSTRYYLRSETSVKNAGSGGGVNLMAITGFDLTEQRQYVGPDEYRPPEPAPQAQLANLADPLQKRILDGDWDGGFNGLIQLLTEDRRSDQLDSLLRFIVLRRVLDIAKQGSHSLEIGFRPTWKVLENPRPDLSANWLAWDDPAVDNARDLARRALQTIGKQDEQRAKASETWRQDTAPLPSLPQWVGWLRPLGNGWKCETKEPLKAAGELFVLAPMSGSAGEIRPTWKRVAAFDGQHVSWVTSDDGRFLGGRPIFLVATPIPRPPDAAASR